MSSSNEDEIPIYRGPPLTLGYLKQKYLSRFNVKVAVFIIICIILLIITLYAIDYVRPRLIDYLNTTSR